MAVFSKAGYTLVAKALSGGRRYPRYKPEDEIIDVVAARLADMFALDCKNFDRQRFLRDAGVIPNKETTHGASTS